MDEHRERGIIRRLAGTTSSIDREKVHIRGSTRPKNKGRSSEAVVTSDEKKETKQWGKGILVLLHRSATVVDEGRQGRSSPVVLLGVHWPIRKKKGEGINDLQRVFGGTRQERRKKRGYFLVSTGNQHTSDVFLGSNLENEAKEGKGEVLPLSPVIRRVVDGGSHRFFFPCRWYPRT
ncbi:unnamed protein product [Lactuca saligna]|uniref:Uncharacterized protein n=1 Tax=Lactuca saligna TaxID=75948 RepID=A0AA35ZUV6_LACSI|nr:unnamed protein product [Lactuca saligna]